MNGIDEERFLEHQRWEERAAQEAIGEAAARAEYETYKAYVEPLEIENAQLKKELERYQMNKAHTPEWIERALKRTSSDFVNPKNLWKGRLITRSEYVIGYLVGEDILVGDVVDMTEDYCTTEFWARVEPSTLEKVYE